MIRPVAWICDGIGNHAGGRSAGSSSANPGAEISMAIVSTNPRCIVPELYLSDSSSRHRRRQPSLGTTVTRSSRTAHRAERSAVAHQLHISPLMKIRVALALLTSLATPALAEDSTDPKSLSDEQVAAVVKAHRGDVDACWKKLAPKDRASDSNVVLGLSIAPAGNVVDTTIISDAPAETRSCIAAVTRDWQFPTAELASDVEYALTLRAR